MSDKPSVEVHVKISVSTAFDIGFGLVFGGCSCVAILLVLGKLLHAVGLS